MLDQAETLRKEFMGDFPPEKFEQRVIAIASGKGGVGKSNIAVNLGIIFASLGRSSLVMDADLGLANINVLTGLVSDYNIFHVVKGLKTIEEIIMPTPYNIRIISGASGFAQVADMDDENRQDLIDNIEAVVEEDIILVDTGAGISKNVISFTSFAHETIIVTTPEPTSITDAYGIIKAMAAESDDIKIKLIVNMAKDTLEGKTVSERITSIAKQFLNVDVEYLGFIFEDSNVPQAVMRQTPFYVYDNKSRASVSLANIAKRILNIKDDNSSKKRGIGNLVDTFVNMYSKH